MELLFSFWRSQRRTQAQSTNTTVASRELADEREAAEPIERPSVLRKRHFSEVAQACDDAPSEAPPLQDFGWLVNHHEFSDVQFLVGPSEEKIYGHKNILASRSAYFRSCLSSEWKESNGLIRKPNICAPVFLSVLRYLYTGQVVCADEYLLDLMKAADEFGLDNLKEESAVLLCKIVSCENALAIWEAAFRHNQSRLLEFCIDFISSNAMEVMRKGAFQISPVDLSWLLNHDRWYVDEIETWRLVLAWAQWHCDIPTPSSSWVEEERQRLASYIEPLLPCVRFFLIPPKHFLEVEETQLVPQSICYEWLRWYALPDLSRDDPRARHRSCAKQCDDSILLTAHNVKGILEQLELTDSRFKLLYRASRDGFSHTVFHNRCDNKGPTVVVARTADNQIHGAYNSSSWNQQCPDHFECKGKYVIFTLQPFVFTQTPLIEHTKNRGPSFCVFSYSGHHKWQVTCTFFIEHRADGSTVLNSQGNLTPVLEYEAFSVVSQS